MVVLTIWAVFRTVPGKVPYFSTLETGIGRVVRGGGISLEIVLWAISLISVGVLPSAKVIASVVSLVVPLSWRPVPVNIHWDGGVVHPPWCVR